MANGEEAALPDESDLVTDELAEFYNDFRDRYFSKDGEPDVKPRNESADRKRQVAEVAVEKATGAISKETDTVAIADEPTVFDMNWQDE